MIAALQASCSVLFLISFLFAVRCLVELALRWEHRRVDEHTVVTRRDRWTT